MTRDELVALIQSCDWDDTSPFNLQPEFTPHGLGIYQSVNLPGISLPGQRDAEDERLGILEHLDLEGRTYCDLGCNLGVFVYRAAELGAARAVGIEGDQRYVTCCGHIADYLGLKKTEFHRAVLGETPLPGEFDVVTLFSVWHHVRHWFRFLLHLRKACRETLVVEFDPLRRSLRTRRIDREIRLFEWVTGLKRVGEFEVKREEFGYRPIVVFRRDGKKPSWCR